jgi:hypothetical protein
MSVVRRRRADQAFRKKAEPTSTIAAVAVASAAHSIQSPACRPLKCSVQCTASTGSHSAIPTSARRSQCRVWASWRRRRSVSATAASAPATSGVDG